MLNILLFMMVLAGSDSIAYEWESLSPGAGGVFLDVKVDPDDSNTVYLASDVAGMKRSDDNGSSWKSICKGLSSGYVQSIEFDPDATDALYISASDGIYHSTDRGENWSRVGGLGRIPGERISPGLPGALRVAGNGTNKTIYVGTGEKRSDGNGSGMIWVFRAGSTNWNAYSIGMTDPSRAVYSIVCRPEQPDVVWISTGDGVYRSGDRGESWQDKSEGLPHRRARQMHCQPYNTHYLTVVMGADGSSPGGVYYRDGTYTWQNKTGDLPSTNSTAPVAYKHLAVDLLTFTTNGPQTMIVGADQVRDGYYKTVNGGETWAKIPEPGNVTFGWFSPWFASRLLYYDPTSSDSIFIGGDQRLMRSVDGTNFVDVTSVLHAESASIYQRLGDTTDSHYTLVSGSWKAAGETDSMVARMVSFDPFNPERIFISVADNVLFRSEDAGVSFRQIKFKLGEEWVGGAFGAVFHPDQPGRAYALIAKGYGSEIGEGAVTVSEDNGDSWRLLAGTTNAVGGLPGKEPHQMVFGPADSAGNRRMFVSLFTGGVYESLNQGRTWTQVGLANMPVRQIAVKPTNDNVLYAGVTGGAHRGVWKLMRDSYGVWSEVKKISDVDCWNVQAKDWTTSFAATGSGLYRTVDQGVTWSLVNLPSGVSTNHIWGLHCDGNRIYAASFGADPAVFASTDSGVNWTNITRNLGHPRARWLTSSQVGSVRYLYAATAGQGVWRLRLTNAE